MFMKDLFLGKRDVRGTRNRAARHEFKQFDTLLTEKSNENRIRVITLNSLIHERFTNSKCLDKSNTLSIFFLL